MKVGIASFAHVHSAGYAAVLNNIGDVAEFVGITDDDVSRGREAAERFGVPFMEDSAELVEVSDAIIVCSANRDHARYAVEALERGIHVLCEKPIATTVEDARAMIEAADKGGAQMGIAFPVRYQPEVLQAKAAIESGEIGRIIAINGTNHGQIPGGWFLDLDASGGGAVMDHTVHLADVFRWMLGTEVESVYAEVGSFYGSGVDDGAILTMEFENGAFATIDPSWSRGEGYPTWGDVTMRIIGTEGVIVLDAFARSTTIFNHDPAGTQWSYNGPDMNEFLIRDFLSGIETGSSDVASAVDGLRTLEVVLAAYQSGHDHEPVRVERHDA